MRIACSVFLLSSVLFGCTSELSSSGEGTIEEPVVSETETVAPPSSDDLALFVGFWEGKVQMAQADIDHVKSLMDEESFNELMANNDIVASTIEFFEDGTFEMSDMARGLPFSDTWSVSGDTITLASSGADFGLGDEENAVEFRFNRSKLVPNKVPMTLSVEEDGTQLAIRGATVKIFKRKVPSTN